MRMNIDIQMKKEGDSYIFTGPMIELKTDMDVAMHNMNNDISKLIELLVMFYAKHGRDNFEILIKEVIPKVRY